MSQALYRKYRPQVFAQVMGQDVVSTIVKNAVASGRISHAYLFTGPRGVGKTTLARILAKAVNCLSPQAGEPDTTCQNCQIFQNGRFIDLFEIDAASYTGVDNIRGIIDHVKFPPSIGRFKVFIVDEVHMLSKAAFNALLKTLEEPPAHVIFILATTELQKVPATIISRCQMFSFRQIPHSIIVEVLESVVNDLKVGVSKEALALVAKAATGSLRDSLSILDQLLSFGKDFLTLENIEDLLGETRTESSQIFLGFLARGQGQEAAAYVKKMVFDGKDIVLFLKNFLEYLRMILLVKIGVGTAKDYGISAEESMGHKQEDIEISLAKLLEIIKAMIGAFREAKNSPLPELPLLVEILQICPSLDSEKKNQSKIENARHDGTTSLTMGRVVEKWAEVLSKVRDYNHSLLSSLRLGRIVDLKGLDLTLAFPYNFHKETIEARKNKIVVEQVLEDVYLLPLKTKIYLERELPVNDMTPQNKDLISEAIKVLQGE